MSAISEGNDIKDLTSISQNFVDLKQYKRR